MAVHAALGVDRIHALVAPAGEGGYGQKRGQYGFASQHDNSRNIGICRFQLGGQRAREFDTIFEFVLRKMLSQL